MIYTYIELLSIVATFSTFIVALLKNKTLVNEMRVLFLYAFASVLIEILAFALAQFKIHNLFLINGFIIIQFTLFSLFYHKVFSNKKDSIVIVIILLCYYGVSIYENVFFDRLEGINISSVAMGSLVLMCFSLVSFYKLIKNIEYANVFQNPLFWVNSSVLIYFSGSLFLFIFSNYILKQPDNRIWILHNILNLVYNTLLIIAFWKTSKK